MSEIAPYDDDELSEHGLRLRCKELRVENQRLRDEFKRLESRLDLDQMRVDAVCYYRNLAIILGAKPEQMRNSWDRSLCERGINPHEDTGGMGMNFAQEMAWMQSDADKLEILVEFIQSHRESAASGSTFERLVEIVDTMTGKKK